MMTSRCILIILFITCLFQLNIAQEEPVVFFEEEQIAYGITWRQMHTRIFFDSWQFINLIEIEKNASWSSTIAYTNGRVLTSELADSAGAIIAINAGFFDVKNGGSVSYLKVDEEVIDSIPRSDRMIDAGSFTTDQEGKVDIDWSQPIEYYSDDRFYDDVLLSGPMLIKDGRHVPQDSSKAFVSSRHPRSCACLDAEGDFWLIAVDGRNDQAAGMSLMELQQYLATLNCLQAINLDGGGSTTIWIKDKGVVNHPSDNKQFDTEGERAVANIILIKPK
jgi:exopolysaccharide biosynthesis protein